MHTDDDVWAPALKQTAHVTNTALVKKLARVWTNAIDDPVVILHPVLPVAQQPVVKTDQLVREMMRLLDRTHDANRIRLTVEKLLHTGNDRSRSGTMPAACVGRDDQDLRYARLVWHR